MQPLTQLADAARAAIAVGDLPDSVIEATAEAIGKDAYDCVRVWSAWGVGTMGPDDFVPIADDGDLVAEIARAAIESYLAAMQPAQAATEQSGEADRMGELPKVRRDSHAAAIGNLRDMASSMLERDESVGIFADEDQHALLMALADLLEEAEGNTPVALYTCPQPAPAVPEGWRDVLFGNFDALDAAADSIDARGMNCHAEGIRAVAHALKQLAATPRPRDAARWRYAAENGFPRSFRQIHPTRGPREWHIGEHVPGALTYETPEAAIDATMAQQDQS
ncbi:hypothetical protein [Chromobacterium subtsugae]|uniref:hypothetical protein n=1 Tax=Chromobacterium subtsugae TaxID=251747 RepID=UPI0007F93C46|nr:hypothetical protein [Chromobacterium subtsugae]OBU84423.1 hypothetical protein MY55_22235 [Chromobacterium subtsugae]